VLLVFITELRGILKKVTMVYFTVQNLSGDAEENLL
jgi:hypothetical protein